METKQHATKKNPIGQRGNKKTPQDKWQWKHNRTKSMGCSISSPKMEVHSNTGLPQKTRKISSKQPNVPPKRIRKRRTN